jgi:hypothetical protein
MGNMPELKQVCQWVIAMEAMVWMRLLCRNSRQLLVVEQIFNARFGIDIRIRVHVIAGYKCRLQD